MGPKNERTRSQTREWRERAAGLRAAAERTSAPATRSALLDLAATWDGMADGRERGPAVSNADWPQERTAASLDE